MISETGAIAARVLRVRLMPERLFVPLTIFLGGTLLFAVEPMIAKMILPWFGGSAEVWIVCLLFFQAALLAGYLYAHLLTTRLDARWQLRVHLSLLVVSLLFLPVIPAERWKPAGGEEPLPFILGVLASTIGLPFLLLASTGPLVQAWLVAFAVGSSRRLPNNLPALCLVECRLAAGASPLPGADRTLIADAGAGLELVGGLLCFCPLQRGGRVELS